VEDWTSSKKNQLRLNADHKLLSRGVEILGKILDSQVSNHCNEVVLSFVQVILSDWVVYDFVAGLLEGLPGYLYGPFDSWADRQEWYLSDNTNLDLLILLNGLVKHLFIERSTWFPRIEKMCVFCAENFEKLNAVVR